MTFSAPIKKEHNNGKTTTYKLKFIDSYRLMQDSLSNLADNLSGIDNKKPENKSKDNVRSMTDSLSQSINKISQIDRKISQSSKKSQSIDKVSEIDKKISQIDKKETENKCTHSVRSMINSLSQSIDKVSEIDNKISHATLIEKFYNTYQLCNKDLNKFDLLLRKGVYP